MHLIQDMLLMEIVNHELMIYLIQIHQLVNISPYLMNNEVINPLQLELAYALLKILIYPILFSFFPFLIDPYIISIIIYHMNQWLNYLKHPLILSLELDIYLVQNQNIHRLIFQTFLLNFLHYIPIQNHPIYNIVYYLHYLHEWFVLLFEPDHPNPSYPFFLLQNHHHFLFSMKLIQHHFHYLLMIQFPYHHHCYHFCFAPHLFLHLHLCRLHLFDHLP
mmetsp:Transcript_8898/g.7997  ORF Transcript_8898/g.7997 Transcript_8898/m.7997 type:complete len:219 (-) Transcript_8898:35-691(-)